MRASLKKALEDYNLYLKKLGIDKIKPRKSRGTFVFDGGVIGMAYPQETRYRYSQAVRSNRSPTQAKENCLESECFIRVILCRSGTSKMPKK